MSHQRHADGAAIYSERLASVAHSVAESLHMRLYDGMHLTHSHTLSLTMHSIHLLLDLYRSVLVLARSDV